ncbi:MAG: DUF1292 domain-containing protein [Blautia sp.]|nr:DUF1292 domain-containing protein [Blautia sp.]
MEKTEFRLDDGTKETFFVEEQTVIGGVSYLLVSDSMEDEASAYIKKDISEPESEDACYEMVEDEKELNAVFRVFQELMSEEASLEE